VNLEPYLACSPEDEGLGAGTAHLEVCTGRAEDCPGNPPFTYDIDGGDINGRCEFTPGSPMSLTFSLRDEDQSLSITANDLRFTPVDGELVVAETGEATRFSIYLPDRERPFSTTELASPPTPDTCEVRVRYIEGEDAPGFALEFTCNAIDMSFTDDKLTTISAGAMGPGTVAMGGCSVAE
jgi:hypothetical protein